MRKEHNDLIEKLSNLKLEEKYIIRLLDKEYNNRKLRSKKFERLTFIRQEIKKINFRLSLEREKYNAKNNNTNSTKN